MSTHSTIWLETAALLVVMCWTLAREWLTPQGPRLAPARGAANLRWSTIR